MPKPKRRSKNIIGWIIVAGVVSIILYRVYNLLSRTTFFWDSSPQYPKHLTHLNGTLVRYTDPVSHFSLVYDEAKYVPQANPAFGHEDEISWLTDIGGEQICHGHIDLSYNDFHEFKSSFPISDIDNTYQSLNIDNPYGMVWYRTFLETATITNPPPNSDQHFGNFMYTIKYRGLAHSVLEVEIWTSNKNRPKAECDESDKNILDIVRSFVPPGEKVK